MVHVASPPSRHPLATLTRAELQRLAKQHGIRANLSSAVIIAELIKKIAPEDDIDQHECRHVLVPWIASLQQLKMEILKAFDDQYAPDEVTLYTRQKGGDALPVVSDEDAKTSLCSGTTTLCQKSSCSWSPR